VRAKDDNKCTRSSTVRAGHLARGNIWLAAREVLQPNDPDCPAGPGDRRRCDYLYATQVDLPANVQNLSLHPNLKSCYCFGKLFAVRFEVVHRRILQMQHVHLGAGCALRTATDMNDEGFQPLS
jgi:hypothetical protein